MLFLLYKTNKQLHTKACRVIIIVQVNVTRVTQSSCAYDELTSAVYASIFSGSVILFGGRLADMMHLLTATESASTGNIIYVEIEMLVAIQLPILIARKRLFKENQILPQKCMSGMIHITCAANHKIWRLEGSGGDILKTWNKVIESVLQKLLQDRNCFTTNNYLKKCSLLKVSNSYLQPNYTLQFENETVPPCCSSTCDFRCFLVLPADHRIRYRQQIEATGTG